MLEEITGTTALGPELENQGDTTEETNGPLPCTVIFPKLYTSTELSAKQGQYPCIACVLEVFNKGRELTAKQLKKEPKSCRAILRKWKRLVVRDSVLYCCVNDPDSVDTVNSLFVAPETMRPQILESAHDLSGHQGAERTLTLLRKRCYWPGMDENVKDRVRNCERCLLSKAPFPKVRPKIGICGHRFHSIGERFRRTRTRIGYDGRLHQIDCRRANKRSEGCHRRESFGERVVLSLWVTSSYP